jgi:YggT family protein
MFVVSNFILTIARLLEILLEVYFWIIVVRALLSWVNPDRYNPIVRFLYQVTEPVLRPIRRRLSMQMGLDLSPLIVILVIKVLQWFLVDSLRDLAVSLR